MLGVKGNLGPAPCAENRRFLCTRALFILSLTNSEAGLLESCPGRGEEPRPVRQWKALSAPSGANMDLELLDPRVRNLRVFREMP